MTARNAERRRDRLNADNPFTDTAPSSIRITLRHDPSPGAEEAAVGVTLLKTSLEIGIRKLFRHQRRIDPGPMLAMYVNFSAKR
jgi:hypothetical protein